MLYILCTVAGVIVGGLVTLLAIAYRCTNFPDGILTINTKDYDIPLWNFDLSNVSKTMSDKRLLILKIKTIK